MFTKGDKTGRLAYYCGVQLRRGPPAAARLDARNSQLRVVKAPFPSPRAPRGSARLKAFNSYSIRIVAGLLLVSIPLSIVLGFLMSTWSAQTSISQSKARAEATAENVEVRIGDWLTERKSELRNLAHDVVGRVSTPGMDAILVASAPTHPAFDNIQVVDPNGKVVASSRAGAVLSAMPTGASFANSLIAETLGPIQLGKNAGTIDWIMTAPILGLDEQSQGVIIADLNVLVLGKLVNPFGLDDPTVRDQEVHLVNAQHLIVYSSDWGILKDDQALIAMGALKANGEGGIYEQAMTVGPGTAQIVDCANHGLATTTIVIVTVKDLDPAEEVALQKAGATAVLRKGPGVAEMAADIVARSLVSELVIG